MLLIKKKCDVCDIVFLWNIWGIRISVCYDLWLVYICIRNYEIILLFVIIVG